MTKAEQWLEKEVEKLGFEIDFCDYDSSFSIYDRGCTLMSFYGDLDKLNMYDSHISFINLKQLITIAEEYKRKVQAR